MAEWGVLLNGVYLSGGDGVQWEAVFSNEACTGLQSVAASGISGCLTEKPDGLGLPELRTEDQTFTQRDGIVHYNDWYGPRIITLKVTVTDEGCADCTSSDQSKSARRHVRDIIQAFQRQCQDVEMVLYTDCTNTDLIDIGFGEGGFGENGFGGQNADTDLTDIGPYAVIGRPRQAQLEWVSGTPKHIANLTLRFDCTDQRIYILDPCGTPGFTNSVEVPVGSIEGCAPLPFCFTDSICFTDPVGDSQEPTDITIGGTQCVFPTIIFWPGLLKPRIENVTTQQYITYGANITGSPVYVNTEDMTATQDGVSVTHLLGGTFNFSMIPGEYELRLLSQSPDDDGWADVQWRDTVLSA